MVLYLISLIFLLALIYLALVIAFVAVRNYRAHQFFKHKNPNLPVVPNGNLFTGAGYLFISEHNVIKIDEFHKKLGKTYGFYYLDKPFVSSTDLELIKQLTIVQPKRHLDRFSLRLPAPVCVSGNILFCEGEQDQRIRKAFASALTPVRFRSPNVKAQIDGVIANFINSLEFKLKAAEAESGKPEIVEDINDAFNRFSFAMIFTCFFRQPNKIDFYAKKDSFLQRLKSCIETFKDKMVPAAILFKTYVPLFILIEFIHPTRLLINEGLEMIRHQTKMNLEERKQMNEAKATDKSGKFDPDNFQLRDGSKFSCNLIDHVIDQYRVGKLTHDEYFHTTFAFIFAGGKTTPDALTTIIYHLALYEEYQVKLRRSIIEKGVESEYLLWVINESLRLFPPVDFGCSRTAACDMQCEAGLIPAGTVVITSAYSVHRLTQYWGQDAEEFKPERWTNTDHFHPMQYIPFGAGLRGCPGKEFAMNEIKLLLDTMLRRYKFELVPDTASLKDFHSPGLIFTVPQGPINIKLSRI